MSLPRYPENLNLLQKYITFKVLSSNVYVHKNCLTSARNTSMLAVSCFDCSYINFSGPQHLGWPAPCKKLWIRWNGFPKLAYLGMHSLYHQGLAECVLPGPLSCGIVNQYQRQKGWSMADYAVHRRLKMTEQISKLRRIVLKDLKKFSSLCKSSCQRKYLSNKDPVACVLSTFINAIVLKIWWNIWKPRFLKFAKCSWRTNRFRISFFKPCINGMHRIFWHEIFVVWFVIMRLVICFNTWDVNISLALYWKNAKMGYIRYSLLIYPDPITLLNCIVPLNRISCGHPRETQYIFKNEKIFSNM